MKFANPFMPSLFSACTSSGYSHVYKVWQWRYKGWWIIQWGLQSGWEWWHFPACSSMRSEIQVRSIEQHVVCGVGTEGLYSHYQWHGAVRQSIVGNINPQKENTTHQLPILMEDITYFPLSVQQMLCSTLSTPRKLCASMIGPRGEDSKHLLNFL